MGRGLHQIINDREKELPRVSPLVDTLLSWKIEFCEGLWNVVSPLGGTTFSSDDRRLAAEVWSSEQGMRPVKRWYRILVAWIAEGIVSEDELAILLILKRLKISGRLVAGSARRNPRFEMAITALGVDASTKIAEYLLAALRAKCAESSVTLVEMRRGFERFEGGEQDRDANIWYPKFLDPGSN